MKTSWGSPLPLVALVALGLWTAVNLGLTVVQVRGASMTPTFTDGQVVLVNRFAYGIPGPIIGQYLWIWKAPNLGDTVVVQRPDVPELIVKRVAGVAGTDLAIRGHHLVVGDRSVPLTPAQEYWLAAVPQVPEGQLFLLGDNPSVSFDSRDWGFIDPRAVVGAPW